MDSPPKMKMAKSTTKVVNEVFKVLLMVLFTAALMTLDNFQLGFSLKYSRMRSNTTTVSFNEYPITVKIAAIKAWSISIENGITFLSKENKPKTIMVSCITAATAPKLNCHLLKRKSMYKNTTINDPSTAHTEALLISLAMVGPTFIDCIKPICLDSSSIIKSLYVYPCGNCG